MYNGDGSTGMCRGIVGGPGDIRLHRYLHRAVEQERVSYRIGHGHDRLGAIPSPAAGRSWAAVYPCFLEGGRAVLSEVWEREKSQARRGTKGGLQDP